MVRANLALHDARRDDHPSPSWEKREPVGIRAIALSVHRPVAGCGAASRG
jgi:hypothetical protein